MEGIQYIKHRVTNGTYQAFLRWRLVDGAVWIKQPNEWILTDIPVEFIKDFELEEIE